jgi:hypothetical protein
LTARSGGGTPECRSKDGLVNCLGGRGFCSCGSYRSTDWFGLGYGFRGRGGSSFHVGLCGRLLFLNGRKVRDGARRGE